MKIDSHEMAHTLPFTEFYTLMIAFYFAMSLIMAAQATYPLNHGLMHAPLKLLCGLGSIITGFAFSQELLQLFNASSGATFVFIITSIPFACGFFLSKWAVK